jgi:hypothetical protein
MLLNDPIISLRLKSEPEFVLRLQEVLATWQLEDKPGLFLQARPAENSQCALDLDQVAIRNAIREGVADEAYPWDNFEAPVIQRALHGLTGLNDSQSPEWIFEVHRDGHLLAGVWKFPTLPTRDGESLVIADWYARFFTQFFAHAATVMRAANARGEFVATATLVNARSLRFAEGRRGVAASIKGRPANVDNAQWLLQRAPIESQSWLQLGPSMARGVEGIYRVARGGG